MAPALPAGLYPSGSVAAVNGATGTGAGILIIPSTLFTGRIADR